MRQIDAHGFRDVIAHMKMSLVAPLRFNLHLHTISEYAAMRCYIDEGISRHFGGGFAITTSGELINLYSVKKEQGDRLVQEAIARGAKHLDCYDGHLGRLYERNGFKVVSRETWNPIYAHPHWDEKEYGTPDVLFMEL